MGVVLAITVAEMRIDNFVVTGLCLLVGAGMIGFKIEGEE